MDSIDMYAERVVAWLGEESERLDGEFAFGLRLQAAKMDPFGTGRDWTQKNASLVGDYCKAWPEPEAIDLAQLFLSRRYLRRRGILQELCFGASITVLYATHILPSGRFRFAFEAHWTRGYRAVYYVRRTPNHFY
ncbi:hypothetical protein AC579_5120 [Pseudocercospora musae]|uniref:Uncharacterized protein n=1 Tax=Pseudocercospora musae TaxID=113226 RepID=A0A139INV8_9PEZI|nr:hypothetical protein AC579_5120 [Pseudocercospora musae]